MKRSTLVLRTLADVERATGWVRSVFDAQAGKPLNLTLQDFKAPRTLNQNSTAHLWFGEIADQTGHTPDEIKDELKDLFLPKVERQVFGRTKLVPKATSDLSRQEFMDFMEQVQMFAAEWGIELTQPDAKSWQKWRAEAQAEQRRAA